MNRLVVLRDAAQARPILTAIWGEIRDALAAGKPLQLEVKPMTRTSDQSARFHAMCQDFARAGVPFAGKPRTRDEWKVLLVSAHSVATKQGAEMVPGLEGEFVNIRESTSRMSVARMSSLIEYTRATGDAMGVEWSEPVEIA